MCSIYLQLTQPSPSQERKYFDSGDYALSKAGKASDTGVTTIGSEHPQPGHIPHLSANSPPNNTGPSPSSENFPNSTTSGQPASHRGSSSSMNGGSTSRSPVKEASSFLARTASVDEEAVGDDGDMAKPIGHAAETGDLSKNTGAIPIRR